VADGDDADLGGAWIVVERLPGTADPRAILAGDGVPPAEKLIDDLAAALARVHRIAPAGIALTPIHDPLADLRAMYDRLGQPHPVFELAFRELAANGPPPRALGTTVVHGDFRMGNVLVGAGGLEAVLDWELAHVGDPVADLAWPCVPAWRFTRPDRPAFGLGTREELAAAYERHAGVAVDRDALGWWELHGTLRWGVICVVQAFTHLAGAERSLEHAVIGRRACEVEWDLLALLDPRDAPLGTARPTVEAATPHDRPTAEELLVATRAELGDDVLPALAGREAFKLRVALRALGIVERETRLRGEHGATRAAALANLGVADEAQLAAALRDGTITAGRDTYDMLRALVRIKLEAANPRYLETYP
jgi:aminoglycoside phosphotransferase (APT) family kinase protein